MNGIIPGAFALHTNYQKNRRGLETAMSRLARGDRYGGPGHEPAALLSISERLRNQVRGGEASSSALKRASHFLNTADAHAENVHEMMQRLVEIAANASQNLKVASDREAYQIEFDSILSEITALSRESRFVDQQMVGRDVIASYDANSERFRFWQETGAMENAIEADFSKVGRDKNQTLIGFDDGEDFTLSRDGKQLYYFGPVTGDGAGVRRLKSYDIATGTVTISTDFFASGDKLLVDEQGDLYANMQGTLASIDRFSMNMLKKITSGLSVETEFSVFKGNFRYHRAADDFFVELDGDSGGTTALTGAVTLSGGDHSFSASGNYFAEEDPDGSIRVVDMRTGNESTLPIGGSDALANLQFNEAGDRIYYINYETSTVDFIQVATDLSDTVQLSKGGTLIQGQNKSSFQGLDLGGANPTSNQSFVLAQGSLSEMEYEAVDLSLYALGLTHTRVDSVEGATAAIADVEEAMNRVSAGRAKIRARASRFQFALDGHRNYLQNLRSTESLIRDVDMAEESTRLSGYQVRTQAAQAVIAQFNSLHKNVLQLLM